MHPEKADLDALDGVLRLIDEHAETIVCVGEVGLDFSRHLIGESGGERAERAKGVQREVFRRQARRAEVRCGCGMRKAQKRFSGCGIGLREKRHVHSWFWKKLSRGGCVPSPEGDTKQKDACGVCTLQWPGTREDERASERRQNE